MAQRKRRRKVTRSDIKKSRSNIEVQIRTGATPSAIQAEFWRDGGDIVNNIREPNSYILIFTSQELEALVGKTTDEAFALLRGKNHMEDSIYAHHRRLWAATIPRSVLWKFAFVSLSVQWAYEAMKRYPFLVEDVYKWLQSDFGEQDVALWLFDDVLKKLENAPYPFPTQNKLPGASFYGDFMIGGNRAVCCSLDPAFPVVNKGTYATTNFYRLPDLYHPGGETRIRFGTPPPDFQPPNNAIPIPLNSPKGLSNAPRMAYIFGLDEKTESAFGKGKSLDHDIDRRSAVS